MSGVPFMDVVRTARQEAGGPLPTIQVVTGEARSFLRRAASTAVSTDTPAGATVIPVASTAGLEVGSEITVGTGASARTYTIAHVHAQRRTGSGRRHHHA